MHATSSAPHQRQRSDVWMWLLLAIAAGAVFVYSLSWNSGGTAPAGLEGPAIGRHLPYLRLDPLTGDSTSVGPDDLVGRVTVVNFWGTWCPPCLIEFPHMVKLGEKFAARDDFRLYLVSCRDADQDLTELRQETTAFLASQGTALPTHADQNAGTRRAVQMLLELEAFAYPTTLVFDKSGAIRGFWQGYEPGLEKTIENLVEQLLKEPAKDKSVQ